MFQTGNVKDAKASVKFSSSFPKLSIQIETNRLYINSYIEDNFENCVSLYGSIENTRFFDNGDPRTREEVADLVQKKGHFYFDQGLPFGLFSIFDKEHNLFIGQIDFLPTDEEGVFEIGYIIDKPLQGNGYGTEAAKTIAWSFVEEINNNNTIFGDIYIKKIVATVHPLNIFSKKILTKIGMNFDKRLYRFGKPRFLYSLITSISYQPIHVVS